MKRAKMLQEVRKMRFEEVYGRWQHRGLTMEEAADILGVHERTFRRQCRRYEAEGMQGLLDRRIGNIAHNTADVDEVISLLTLFETRYPKFSTAHFYDKWRDVHGGTRSYVWVKKQLQGFGYNKKAKRKTKHRRKRERKPLPGMMLHQDASTHEWVPGVKWDLIVTLDDATGDIYSAFFTDEEGTWSSFRGVKEVIETRGLFCSIYTDRGSHYWNTPKAGGKVDKDNRTHFGISMKRLGIQMIAAYSPEARGRSERAFRTLQDRLPKELALEGITEMDAANKFLKDRFIRYHNTRFAVAPAEDGSAFVPWLKSNVNLDDILCIRAQRTVNNDNTVKYNGKTLQIPQDGYRYHYVKAEVMVHEYEDGSCSIFHGPRCLARYDRNGEIIISDKSSAKPEVQLEIDSVAEA